MARRDSMSHRRNGGRPILEALAKDLAQDRRVRFAYVHGSFLTRRDARDIDVAVYLKNGGDSWLAAQEIAGRLERAIAHAFRVDVHALNTAAASFAFQVLTRGRVVCDQEKRRRLDWEAHRLSAYQDLKPMLDFHDRRFLSR